MYVIYALVDPRDNTVRYVGMTSDVYKRFFEHTQCGGSNFEKNAWIMEMRDQNVMPLMVELERTESQALARKREAYWIQHFISLQSKLMNILHNKYGYTPPVTSLAPYRETILKTISLMAINGEKLTRTALRDKLGWDNRQYQEILKPALDEMGLLKVNS
jgi:predicted GIY-YIG superfamily endonuclease